MASSSKCCIVLVLALTVLLRATARNVPDGLREQKNFLSYGGVGGYSGIGNNGMPFSGIGGVIGGGGNGFGGGFTGGIGLGGNGGLGGLGGGAGIGGGSGGVPSP